MDIETTEKRLATASALESYAELAIETETAKLRELIDIIDQAVDIRMVDGQVLTDIKLTAFELEALAMRIPAECLRIQSQINKYNVKNAFQDIKLEAQTTVSQAKLVGTKGTAEERRRMAELDQVGEKLQSAVNKLIIKGLQSCIDRADKAYEGVKKVMDYRSKEGWFDRKGPQ